MTPQELWQVASYITPFGLVAFMVIWNSLKTQPQMEKRMDVARGDYLAAEANARQEYLKALAEQRIDFVNERQHDRETKRQLIESFNKLAELTAAHVLEARTVWKQRGEMP